MGAGDYSPEKAGVGGSIPSLATTKINNLDWLRTAEGSARRAESDCPHLSTTPRSEGWQEESGVSDRALNAHLMIGRYDQASNPLIDRLRRDQQDHPRDEGISTGLREPHR
jgi:hypothetical protein